MNQKIPEDLDPAVSCQIHLKAAKSAAVSYCCFKVAKIPGAS